MDFTGTDGSDAQSLIHNALLWRVLKQFELEAIDKMIFAATDDETRRNAATEVRTIRSLQPRLQGILEDAKAQGVRKAAEPQR
jgi:hypothetical protein